MAGTVHVIDHPLVQHKLSLMRSKETSTSSFRTLLREISMLLAYEVCRDLPTTLIPIETPIAPTMAPILDGPTLHDEAAQVIADLILPPSQRTAGSGRG